MLGYVVMVNVVLLGCIVIGWLVIVLFWCNCMNIWLFFKIYVFVVFVLGLVFMVEVIFLGLMIYLVGLVIVGIILIGIMLLDLCLVVFVFVMGVILFWVNDMVIYVGFFDYVLGYGD